MREESKKILSDAIKFQRFKENKTQENCAKYLNISVPTYRELEYNPNKLELEQAIKLGEYLNFDLIKIFFENNIA